MTSATSINQHKRRMPLELRGFAAFYAMGRSDAKNPTRIDADLALAAGDEAAGKMQRADAALRQLPVQYSGASINEPPHRRMVNIETDPDAAYRGQERYMNDATCHAEEQTAVLESTAFPLPDDIPPWLQPSNSSGTTETRAWLAAKWQPHEEAKRPQESSLLATPAAARKIALPVGMGVAPPSRRQCSAFITAQRSL